MAAGTWRRLAVAAYAALLALAAAWGLFGPILGAACTVYR